MNITVRNIQKLTVSILVLVDLALESDLNKLAEDLGGGFNPCFSGSCIGILKIRLIILDSLRGFNPCFSGSCIGICREPPVM